MNNLDDQLRRLLASARQEYAADENGPPFGLEMRVMAEWRALRAAVAAAPADALYRQAILWSLGIACLAILSFVWDWAAISDLPGWQNFEMHLANSALRQHLP